MHIQGSSGQACCSRRAFLSASASCGAHLLFLGANARTWERSWSKRFAVVAQEPWGQLSEIGDGLWALVSTPLEDRTTLCNGGIIAGSDRVMIVESYASAAGAAWMADQARSLTGRWPSLVIVTHFHGDHSGGLAGFADRGSRALVTETTRELVRETDAGRQRAPDANKVRMLSEATVLRPNEPTSFDLGGRQVRVVPRGGHTPSDVTIEIDEPSVIWCGDLVWNRMFPNYRDATPSHLSRDVRALRRDRDTTYVPGHGPLANPADLEQYLALIDDVEAAARRAFQRGTPAVEAATTYQPPESLGEWYMFSPRYYQVALSAWERELRAQ